MYSCMMCAVALWVHDVCLELAHHIYMLKCVERTSMEPMRVLFPQR